MGTIPVVALAGSSRDRGRQHGRELRDMIGRAIAFYGELFGRLGLSTADVRGRAEHFIGPTAALDAELAAEYEGIAEGAARDLRDIYALSARYEITFAEVALGECSNLFVGADRARASGSLLAQNWDWRPEVAEFRVVLQSRADDMPDHVMVSECGQPGKYGLNRAGVGVIAAGLNCRTNASTGPHLYVALQRVALRQESLPAAVGVLAAAAPLATVNVVVADAAGSGYEVEYTPTGPISRHLTTDDVYWHTNHCREADEPSAFTNSLRRGARWETLTSGATDVTTGTVCRWLSDRLGTDRICQTPTSGDERVTTLETLSSIVLDLRERTVWATAGPSHQHPFESYRLPEA